MDYVNGIMLHASDDSWLDFLVGGTLLIVILIILAIYVGIGCFWGWLTNKIIKNKGYTNSWFWWGFFFHLVAVLVACCRPENPNKRDYTGMNINMQYYGSQEYNPYANVQNNMSGTMIGNNADNVKGRFLWKCYRCGALNESYVQICRCGVTKIENKKMNS